MTPTKPNSPTLTRTWTSPLSQTLREASSPPNPRSTPMDLDLDRDLDLDEGQWEGNRLDYAADGVFRGSRLSRKRANTNQHHGVCNFSFFHLPNDFGCVLCLRYF